MNRDKAKNKRKYLLILIYAACYAISYITGIGCVWQAAFHVPCPGCGFTRASLSLLCLDFKSAWEFHPMYWSIFLLVPYFIFEGEVFRSRIINRLVISAVIIGFLGVWIYRMHKRIII